jgi:hypothetical protein
MRSRLAIWLTIELLVAAGVSSSVCLLRRAEARAFIEWRNNPTKENRSALDLEKHITTHHHIVLAAVLFCSMAAVTIPALQILERRRLRHMDNSTSTIEKQP